MQPTNRALPFESIQKLLKERNTWGKGSREHKGKARQDSAYTQASYNTMVWLRNHITYTNEHKQTFINTQTFKAQVDEEIATPSAVKAISHIKVFLEIIKDHTPNQYNWGELTNYNDAVQYVGHKMREINEQKLNANMNQENLDPEEAAMYRPWMEMKRPAIRYILEQNIWSAESVDNVKILRKRQQCAVMLILIDNGPVRRNEVMTLRYEKHADPNVASNWIDWENHVAVFEKYKTSTIYGTFKQSLNVNTMILLEKMIRQQAWIQSDQYPYLFKREEQEDTYHSQFIKEAFHAATGIAFGTIILRKMYISYLKQNNMINDWKDMDKYAKLMGHSVKVQQTSYMKNFEQPNISVDVIEIHDSSDDETIAKEEPEHTQIIDATSRAPTIHNVEVSDDATSLGDEQDESNDSTSAESSQEISENETNSTSSESGKMTKSSSTSSSSSSEHDSEDYEQDTKMTNNQIEQRTVDDLYGDKRLTRGNTVLWTKVLISPKIAFNGRTVAYNLRNIEGNMRTKTKRLVYLKSRSLVWNDPRKVTNKIIKARQNAKQQRENKDMLLTKQATSFTNPNHIRFDSDDDE
jgi:hypothetical protein